MYRQKLSSIASSLLSLPPTSASCERNWSTYDSVHTKKRNRLTNVRSEKLVAVSTNLKQFSGPVEVAKQGAGNVDSDSDVIDISSESEDEYNVDNPEIVDPAD